MSKTVIKRKKKKDEKKKDNWLEVQILAILEKSMKKTLDRALDDMFKGFK